MDSLDKLYKDMNQLKSNIDLEIIKLSKSSGIPFESIKNQLVEVLNQKEVKDTISTPFKFEEKDIDNQTLTHDYQNLKSDLEVTKHVAKLMSDKEVTRVEVYRMSESKKQYIPYRTFTRIN
ncbi:hypothetical protein [Bacillus toyonensis]|uniref:hypothetical protein n=1 Tax=Bacillus toyonensis TaxID=155322 RepID=UPI000BF46BBA|nr:hypothetical protein [Bacillus toyonensis]PGF05020.1 hypothetical protein COM61_00875 [Bacillus toyonensis]